MNNILHQCCIEVVVRNTAKFGQAATEGAIGRGAYTSSRLPKLDAMVQPHRSKTAPVYAFYFPEMEKGMLDSHAGGQTKLNAVEGQFGYNWTRTSGLARATLAAASVEMKRSPTARQRAQVLAHELVHAMGFGDEIHQDSKGYLMHPKGSHFGPCIFVGCCRRIREEARTLAKSRDTVYSAEDFRKGDVPRE